MTAKNPPLVHEQTTTPGWVVESFPVGPLQCNCTIIGNTETGDAVVVDPGGDVAVILAKLKEHGLRCTEILHTHAHFDHFLAADALKQATEAPLALHKQDQPLWEMLPTQCDLFGIPHDGKHAPPPDVWLGDEQPVLGEAGSCLHTPGHTPGSMSFHFPDLELLVAGDTLFKGSVGRTDLWGGDFQQIKSSIQQRLYTLDDVTTVIPGHGPATTIGDECRHNSVVSVSS